MEEILEQVYCRHRQGLFSLALSITGSAPLAEDAIHNTFANLVNRQISEGDIVAYVFKSVRNASLDLMRHRQRHGRVLESLFEATQETTKSNLPYDTMVAQEQSTILQTAIDELATKDREAIVLKTISGLTFEQAGRVTGTSPKTVATRYRRALQKLHQKLLGRL